MLPLPVDESLRAQQKLWSVIEFLWDHGPRFLWTWLLGVGLFAAVTKSQTVFTYAIAIPVFLLLGAAVVLAGLVFFLRILRFLW